MAFQYPSQKGFYQEIQMTLRNIWINGGNIWINEVHAWCIMSNHLHLIVSAEKGNLSSIIRDFKKFTSQTILEQIEKNNEESRRGCPPEPVRTGMLWIFEQAGAANSRNDKYQFWQQDNQPILLETPDFTLIKLNYVHNNPVKAGVVEKPEDYLLSSARDYNGGNGLLPLPE